MDQNAATAECLHKEDFSNNRRQNGMLFPILFLSSEVNGMTEIPSVHFLQMQLCSVFKKRDKWAYDKQMKNKHRSVEREAVRLSDQTLSK